MPRHVRLALIELRDDLLCRQLVVMRQQLQDVQARVVGQRGERAQQLAALDRRRAQRQRGEVPQHKHPDRCVAAEACGVQANVRREHKDHLPHHQASPASATSSVKVGWRARKALTSIARSSSSEPASMIASIRNTVI